MAIENYNILNTCAGAIKNEGIKLTLANKLVFRSYLHYLTHRYEEQEPTDLIPGYYYVWGFNKIPNILLKNKSGLTWEDISNWCINDTKDVKDNDGNKTKEYIPFGSLRDFEIKTISSKTGEDSKLSINELFNFPASAYLFSKTYNGNSYILNDPMYEKLNYIIGNPFEWNETSGVFWNDDKLSSDTNFYREHWQTDYSFSNNYNNIEYKVHEIPDEVLPEDISVISSNVRCRFILDNSYKKIDAIVITYGRNKIPVTYCELHNSCRQVKGYLDLEWSPEGIITVE